MRPVGHLDVGPLRFALQSAELGPACYSDPAYAGFFSTAGAGEPLRALPVDLVRGVSPPPASEPLWRAGGHWAVWEDGADLRFHVGLRAPEIAQLSCRVARDVSRGIGAAFRDVDGRYLRIAAAVSVGPDIVVGVAGADRRRAVARGRGGQ